MAPAGTLPWDTLYKIKSELVFFKNLLVNVHSMTNKIKFNNISLCVGATFCPQRKSSLT
jgi:hypothetical protein